MKSLQIIYYIYLSMLFIHPCKTILFAFLFFWYIMINILHIPSAIKRRQSKDSKTLYLKTFIDEFNLLKKRVIIQWNIKRITFAIAYN